MVSFERYLKAYVTVIPERAKILRERISQKHKLEHGIITKEKIEALISIIGKDTFFQSAEKRKKQTILHYLHKFIKGFDFFLHNRNKIQGKMLAFYKIELENDLGKMPVYKREIYESFGKGFAEADKTFAGFTADMISVFKELDTIYREEVSCLEEALKDIKKGKTVMHETPAILNYIKLSEEEKKILEKLIGWSSELFRYNTKLLSMRRLLMKGWTVSVISLIASCFLGIVFLLGFLLAVAAEASQKELGMLISSTLACFSPLFFVTRRHLATQVAISKAAIQKNPKLLAFSLIALIHPLAEQLVKIFGSE